MGGVFVFIWGGGSGRVVVGVGGAQRGEGLKCYDSIVYIETPAVHIDCNMIYVK